MNFHITERSKHILFIILLIILTVLVRLQSDHQTDFDSYWLHAQAESIQLHGSALWVFHPMSLFGYYPLSYPSGTMFFLAATSALTGLSMNLTVLVTSIFVGLLMVLLTLMVGRKFFKSWLVGYVGAFIVALSPIIVNYTSFNAGGRVLIIPFLLMFLWSVARWQHTSRKRYLLLAVLFLLFSFLTHRTAQLIAVFIVAFFAAWFYGKLPRIWAYLASQQHFNKYVKARYERNRYYLLMDIGVVLIIVVMVKLADLIIRGRLGYNVEKRLVEPAAELLPKLVERWQLIAIVAGAVVLALVLVVLYIRLVRGRKIVKPVLAWLHKHYHLIFEHPQRYFPWLLLLVTAYLFGRQFLGQSFYSPSLYEYASTELFSGTSAPIVFVNMLINYTTSVTPLFIFFFIGFVFLLFKKNKTFLEWFVVFSFIGFSGFLLDKRYVRLFLVPFIAMLCAYAVLKLFLLLKSFSILRLRPSFFQTSLSFLLLFLIILGMFSPLLRSSATGEVDAFDDVGMFWSTGEYLRALDCNCSTITTEELVAGVTIFAASGIPGGSHNIYYFINESLITPQKRPFSEVKEQFLNGDKINLYYLPDWLFGGQYYVGRHTRYLFDYPYTDRLNKRIVSDYHEKYYIHDVTLDSTTFLYSIEHAKDLVYSNPKTIMYSLEKGRDVQ